MPLTLGRLIEACETIELRNAKVYAAFSILLGEKDDQNEKVARFWEHLSIEEWQHYINASFGRAICAKTIGLETPVPEVDAATLEAIGAKIGEIERAVETGDVDLRRAFEMAIDLERSEANAIYQVYMGYLKKAVAKAGKPHLLKRLEATEENVEEHVNELVEQMKRFVGDPALVRQAKRSLA